MYIYIHIGNWQNSWIHPCSIGKILGYIHAKPCSIGKILGYILLSSPSVKDVAPLASIVPFLLICCIAINAVNLLLVFNLILLSVLTPFLLALFGTFCFTTAAMSTLSLFYNISIVICLVAFGMRVVSAPFGKLPMVYCKGTLLVWLFWIACWPPYFVTSLPLRIFLFMHLLMILLLFLLHGKCCTKHISAFSILVNVPILFLIHPSVNYGIKELLVVITHLLLTTSASAFTPFSLALLSMLVYPTLTLLNNTMLLLLLVRVKLQNSLCRTWSATVSLSLWFLPVTIILLWLVTYPYLTPILLSMQSLPFWFLNVVAGCVAKRSALWLPRDICFPPISFWIIDTSLNTFFISNKLIPMPEIVSTTYGNIRFTSNGDLFSAYVMLPNSSVLSWKTPSCLLYIMLPTLLIPPSNNWNILFVVHIDKISLNKHPSVGKTVEMLPIWLISLIRVLFTSPKQNPFYKPCCGKSWQGLSIMLRDSSNLVCSLARFVPTVTLRMKLLNIFSGIVLIGFKFVNNTPN